MLEQIIRSGNIVSIGSGNRVGVGNRNVISVEECVSME